MRFTASQRAAYRLFNSDCSTSRFINEEITTPPDYCMAQAWTHLLLDEEKGHYFWYGYWEKPGPVTISNFGFPSFVDSRIINFNSHLESLLLSLSLHLQMRFNGYTNPQQRFVYSRGELLSICFGSARLQPPPQILSQWYWIHHCGTMESELESLNGYRVTRER